MSRQVDEKVVQMSFENEGFEKNINSSIKSLNELQGTLNNTGAGTAGLNNIASATDSVSVKFGLMNAAITAVFTDIVRKAASTGERLVASLSTDQIVAGYEKYESKTTSVQTIMAATRKEGEGEEEALERVNEQVSKLNRFADETSYSLSDMTNNVGKFTSQGIEMEDAVIAMEGISTWAAVSGQSTNEASRAMYNLSQALSAGSVKVRDWMSIENANMATKEFKETAIQTAIELGELNSNTKVTAQTFRDSLESGWLTTDVLMATLQKYGGFADKIISYVDELDSEFVTVTNAKGWIQSWQDGEMDISQLAEKFGKDTEYVTEMLKSLGVMDEEGQAMKTLGQRAFTAAQEAKTFTEVISATKDAVSTQWLNIFEQIFGDYLEAKELWTDLSETLYDIFAAPLGVLQELIESWSDLEEGGRSDLVEAFFNTLEALQNLLGAVKEAFEEVFPPVTVDSLKNFTLRLKELSEQAKSKSFERLKNILSGILSIIKAGVNVIKQTFTAIKPLTDLLKEGFSIAIDKLSEFSKKINESAGKENALTGIFSVVTKASQKLADSLRKYIPKITELMTKAVTFVKENFFTKFDTTGKSVWDIIWDTLESFMDKGKELFGKFLPLLGKGTVSVTKYISTLIKGLDIKGIIGSVFSKKNLMAINESMSIITQIAAKIVAIKIGSNLAKGSEALANIGDSVRAYIDTARQSLKAGKATKLLTSLAAVIIGITAGLLVMTNALKSLSQIEPEKLTSAVGSLALVMLTMVASVFALTKLDSKKLKKAASALLTISLALGVIMLAIGKMAKNIPDTGTAVAVVISMLGALVFIKALITSLSNLSKSQTKNLKSTSGTMVSLSLAIVGFSLACKVIASVLNTLKDIPFKDGIKAIALMAIIVLGIVSIAKISKNLKFGNILSMSLTMITLGLACKAMSKALKSLSKIDYVGALKGLGVIAAALAGVLAFAVVFSKIKDKQIGKVVVTLLGMSVALGLLTPALLELSLVKFNKVGEGLLVVAAGLLGLIVLGKIAGNSVNPILKLSAAFLVFSVGIGILAAATSLLLASLQLFNTSFAIDSTAVTAAFSAIADGLTTALTKITMWIGEFGPTIFMNLTTSLLTGLQESLPVIMQTLKTTLESTAAFLTENSETLLTIVRSSLDILIAVVTEYTPEIITVVFGLIMELIKMIDENFEPLMNTIWGIIEKLFDFLKEKVPELIERLVDFVCDIIEGLDEKILQIINAVIDFLVDFLNGLADVIRGRNGEIWDAINNVIKAVFEAILNGIKKAIEAAGDIAKELKDWAKDLFSKFKDAFVKKVSEMKEVGKDLLEGLVSGLKEKITYVTDKAKEIGGKVIDKFKDIFGIHSPSKVMAELGGYLDEGLVNGIYSGVRGIEKTAADVGTSTTKSFNNAINEAMNNIDYDFDSDIEITPVMDLSEIRNGVNQANGLLDGIDSAAIQSGFNSVLSIRDNGANGFDKYSQAFSEIKSLLEEALDKPNDVTNEFNITGDNPREIADQVSQILMRQIYNERAATT